MTKNSYLYDGAPILSGRVIPITFELVFEMKIATDLRTEYRIQRNTKYLRTQFL